MIAAPQGLTIDAATGLIQWTPTEAQVGSQAVSVRVTDKDGLTATQDFTIVVAPPNHPPAITSAGIAPQWTKLVPTGPLPSARAHSLTAYDAANDRLIVFGGERSDLAKLNDVWVLANATGVAGAPAWQQLTVTGGPPAARHGGVAAYDPTANRLIIHGGCTGNCGTMLGDAWVLTNANGLGGTPEWLQLPSTAATQGAAAAYDPISNRLMVFGGLTAAGPFSDLNTVRVLIDANGIGNPNWVDLAPAGTLPPPRSELQNAVYDPITNRLMIFGGYRWAGDVEYNDVWVLTNANGLGGTPTWAQIEPQGSPPSGRCCLPISYDPNSNRLILFGGLNEFSERVTYDDSWVLTSANGFGGATEWIKLQPAGPLPAARRHYVGAYDPRTNRYVAALGQNDVNLHGPGGTISTVLNDAWVLSNASGLCTAGQACNFKATAIDPDAGDALSFALDAAPTGMAIDPATGAMTWTPAIAQIGNHAVTVRVTDRGGLFATQTFTATVAPVAVPNVVGLAPEWAESFITAADLTVGTKTSQGGAITLNFDSLPSRQGWEFGGQGFSVSTASEPNLFQIDGAVLIQNTLGIGGRAAGYAIRSGVDPRLPLSIAVRARVSAEEGGTAQNHYGFGFDAWTGSSLARNNLFGVGLGTSVILFQEPPSNAFLPFDNSGFHDYVLRAQPGIAANLVVDGSLVRSGSPFVYPAVPYYALVLGDLTEGPNARAEVTAYSFTQPRVVGQNPPAGTLVPNKTAVDLTIVDGPATETVPSLTGLSQAQASAAILAANLTVGAVTSAPSATIPKDQVSDQSPLPGIHVPKATRVNIVLSTGPPGPINLPPTITSSPVLTATAGQPYSYQVTATDPNTGDVLTYSLATAPAGMTINSASGLISWTPTDAQVGTHAVVVRVTDSGGLAGEQNFVIVAVGNREPSAGSQAFGMLRAIPYLPPFWTASGSITLNGTDPDGDPLSYELVDKPTHGEIRGTPPSLTYVPGACFAGTDRLTFRVSDGKANSGIATVDMHVGEDCNRNGVADSLDIANGTSKDCNGNQVPDECDVRIKGRGFSDIASWTAFDPGANGVGRDPDGYMGGAFDGRYVYFAPYFNGEDHSGEILRYDTQAEFDSPAAWATHDLPTQGFGLAGRGFSGAVFDGRYVYFVPAKLPDAEVIRYDTQGDFSARSSWAAMSLRPAGVISVPTSYFRALFDGRYIYLVPHVVQNGSGNTPRAEVVRYDTRAAFGERQSWSTFDPAGHGIATKGGGFGGAVFDGRHIYLVPLGAEGRYNGEVVRYDTQAEFGQAGSWSAYNSAVHGSISDPHGYMEAAYDGRFVYFGPYLRAGNGYSQVLRYDTTLPFADAGAWGTMDPGRQGVGQTPGGYRGVVFDCRNVYFVPTLVQTGPPKVFHSETLRYFDCVIKHDTVEISSCDT